MGTWWGPAIPSLPSCSAALLSCSGPGGPPDVLLLNVFLLCSCSPPLFPLVHVSRCLRGQPAATWDSKGQPHSRCILDFFLSEGVKGKRHSRPLLMASFFSLLCFSFHVLCSLISIQKGPFCLSRCFPSNNSFFILDVTLLILSFLMFFF